MLTIDWNGRLGNNLFQIAVCYGLADKFGENAEFPSFEYFNLPARSHPIENVFGQPDGNNSVFDIKWKPNLNLVGFFQRHEYFDHIKLRLIKDIFRVPVDYHPDTICVHVRRGDFLYPDLCLDFPVQPDTYYIDAINRIGATGKKVVFCSDDIEYCKSHFFGYFPDVRFREHTLPIDDIFFGANCDAVVMSNSTFSFWMGYLNTRERPIYFPLNWFRKGSPRNGHEICPINWVGL